MLTPYLRVQHHWHREDLLQEYERQFAELPDGQKLSKLCSDDGFRKGNFERTTLHYNRRGI